VDYAQPTLMWNPEAPPWTPDAPALSTESTSTISSGVDKTSFVARPCSLLKVPSDRMMDSRAGSAQDLFWKVHERIINLAGGPRLDEISQEPFSGRPDKSFAK